MCGFAGFWSLTRPPTPETMLHRMAARIAHRGPDADGVWIERDGCFGMAHRRLAIVDPSPAGAQPMTSADGRFCLAYNGEIYNHQALRVELERGGQAPDWRGDCDTETLLAAVAAWGVAALLPRLDGMFAFALRDRRTRRVWLARDRFGEKPLYYASGADGLLFASELGALQASTLWQGSVDPLALARFLRYSHVPAPLSIYAGTRKLGPGELVCLDAPNSIATPRRWYAPFDGACSETDAVTPIGADSALDRLHGILRRSVRSRLMADVPLGAFLSGGTDSSLVVALMQEASPHPVRTFTIGFDDSSLDESSVAAATAARLGTDHVELRVTAGDALNLVPTLAARWDEPFADPSQIPTCMVAALARERVKVALSGDGGDELFSGYTRYAKFEALRRRLGKRSPALRRPLGMLAMQAGSRFGDLLAVLPGPGVDRFVSQADRLADLAEVYASADAASLYDALLAKRFGGEQPVPGLGAWSLASSPFDASPPPATRLARCRDLRDYLPDTVLTKVDRATMAVGLEARAPLLANEVVEFACRAPGNLLRRDGLDKWPLAALLARYLPARDPRAPKRGFGVPLSDWLSGPLRDWADDLLQPGRLRAHGLLDEAVVARWWRAHGRGRTHRARLLWNIVMFQAWWEAQSRS